MEGNEVLMKISIRGVSCSGKTTLAKRLSKELNIEHIELDECYWLPNWQNRELNEFLQVVEKKLKAESWVMDGNYSKVYKGLKVDYDYQVWLDYSFTKIFYRYCKRTFDRVVFKRRVCNGNIENYKSLFSADSLLLWILKTYWKRKSELKILQANGDKKLIVIKKEDDIVRMIENLKKRMR